MRFALFSDQHFGPKAFFAGKLRKLSHEAGTLTRAFVERMNTVERPALVVNLGDVLEDESPERDRARYGEFLRIANQLTAPLIHVAGNHDQIHLSEDDLRELWGHTGALHFSRDVGGVHFVVLNTLETRDVCVRLPEAQLEWVERDLAAAGRPVVVLMHHPASEQDLTGNRWFEKAPHICRLAERRELRRLFEQSGKVVAVFNGHAHWNHLDVIAGIPYVTLQSLIENLDDDAPGRPAACFAVADLEPKRLIVRVEGAEQARYQLELG
ncbi:MAG: metallophosphoesterase [Polyangiaceae bacterium]|nr:metallophosphoesterase [Polyangiaceae bacterium]